MDEPISSDEVTLQYKKGDFSFMSDKMMIQYIEDMYLNAIQLDIMNYLKINHFDSFMWSTDPVILNWVNTCRLKDYHSGASIGICARNVEYIAKHGWDKYVKSFN